MGLFIGACDARTGPRRSESCRDWRRPRPLRADRAVTRATEDAQVGSLIAATHRARDDVVHRQVIDSTAPLALPMQMTYRPTRRLPGSPIPALGSGLTVTLAVTTMDSGMGTAWLQARCQRHQAIAPGSMTSPAKIRRASATRSIPCSVVGSPLASIQRWSDGMDRPSCPCLHALPPRPPPVP